MITPLKRLFALFALSLAACSSPSSEESSACRGAAFSAETCEPGAGDSRGRGSCAPGSREGACDSLADGLPARDEARLGSFRQIATNLASPRGFVMHDGTAYVAAYDGLVEVSPDGDKQKILGQDWLEVAGDRDLLSWTSAGQIVTAPFASLTSQSVTPTKTSHLLAVNEGYVYFLRESAIFRARPGAAPEPVTSGAEGSEIAIDREDLYYFAAPNNTSLEVRRIRKSGGESERIAKGVVTGPNGLGRSLAVSSTTVFFTDGDGTLYTVPRAGGVLPRSIATGVSDVLVTEHAVYYLSGEDSVGRLYQVDSLGQRPKLLAQVLREQAIELAVDDTGLYALQLHGTGTLYKYAAD